MSVGIPPFPLPPWFEPGMIPYLNFDSDGGIISVPNTGVDTTLITLTLGPEAFWLQMLVVSVLDPAAIPIGTWTLYADGVRVSPFSAMRLPPGQFSLPIQINRTFRPFQVLTVRGNIPTTAVGAFDMIGRIIGQFLKRADK